MAGTFEVRLSLRDADTVKRGLQSLGNDGERALKRLEQATQPASRGLQLLDQASGAVQGGLQELASRGGAAGEALAVLGRGGLAAAAGLGAVAVAVAAAIGHLRAAGEAMADLNDQAQRVGVSASQLASLRDTFISNASSAEDLQSALENLQAKIGEAAHGSASVQAQFEAAGISMERLAEIGGDTSAVLLEIAKNGSLTSDQVADLTGRVGKGLQPALEALREQGIAPVNEEFDAAVAHMGAAKDQSALLSEEWNRMGTESAAQLQDALNAIQRMLIDVTKWLDEAGEASQAFWAKIFSKEAWQSLGSMRAALREATGIVPPSPAEQAAATWPQLPAVSATPRLTITPPATKVSSARRSGGGGVSDAARDAERDTKAIADLQKEIELFGRTRDEAIDKATSRLSDHASPDQVAQVKALAGQLYDLGEAQKAAAEAEREHQKLLSEGKSLYAATRTPAEEYADTLARLNELQKAGAIDQTTYNRALDDAKEKASAGDREMAEAHQAWLDQQQHGIDLMGMANDAATMFGSAMTTAFEDAIVGGAKFQDVLTALTTDLQKFVLRMALAGLLRAGADAISGAFTGGSSFSTAGGTNNGWTTGGFQTTPIVNAHGNAFEAGNVIPFARGGLVDRPTLFPMARGTGLMGEAGPEAIAPLRRTASGDLGVQAVAPVVKVTVNNSSNAQVSTETKQDQNGNLDIIFTMVENRMAEQMSRPGTRLNRAVSAANRPVVSR